MQLHLNPDGTIEAPGILGRLNASTVDRSASVGLTDPTLLRKTLKDHRTAVDTQVRGVWAGEPFKCKVRYHTHWVELRHGQDILRAPRAPGPL